MREVPESVRNYGSEFKEIFDTTFGQFVGKLWIVGIPDFDIIKFEKFLVSRGYATVSENQSIAEFVEMRYGIRGRELIDKLINMELENIK